MQKKEEAWDSQKYEAFAQVINSIGAEVKSQMGADDLVYLKKIQKISNMAEITGRSLLQVSLEPLTWSMGVFALWVHYQLETAEIGHAALHGAWDSIEDASPWHSGNFKWKTPVDENSWMKEHNILHHQFTNIVGKDPDLNYGSLRVTEKTSWKPSHFFQITQFFWTAPLFMWAIAVHATGLTDLTHPKNDMAYASVLPDRKPRTFLKALKKTARKMGKYSLKEFVFWPSLAGLFWPKVLAGNLAAEMIRNVYTCATIYAGHFGDDLEYYDKETQSKGRGQWYKNQIEAAHDYKVSAPVSLMCGALDYQIEHHLFPKFPPNRLRQIAPKVRKACREFGVKYQTRSWAQTLSGSLKRLAKMSLPAAA